MAGGPLEATSYWLRRLVLACYVAAIGGNGFSGIRRIAAPGQSCSCCHEWLSELDLQARIRLCFHKCLPCEYPRMLVAAMDNVSLRPGSETRDMDIL